MKIGHTSPLPLQFSPRLLLALPVVYRNASNTTVYVGVARLHADIADLGAMEQREDYRSGAVWDTVPDAAARP